MKEQEKRLLRCIGGMDDPLILEAETRRFPRKHWGGVLALAACAALVIAVPLLWGQTGPEGQETQEQLGAPLQKQEESLGCATAIDAPEAESYPAGEDTETETDHPFALGQWYLGRTEPEEGVEPDDNGLWSGDGLTIRFDPFTGEVCKLVAAEGCTLTLPNGLGIGSMVWEVEAAYPMAKPLDGTYTILGGGDVELTMQTENDVVTELVLQAHGDCLLHALTVSELTIYTTSDAGRTWDAVRVIGKAAKRICTTLTISEPEPWEEGTANHENIWIDFGNGAALAMDGHDYASIWAYSGEKLDPARTDGITWVMNGVFTGLNGTVTQALADPTEIWETMPIEPPLETESEEAIAEPEGVSDSVDE